MLNFKFLELFTIHVVLYSDKAFNNCFLYYNNLVYTNKHKV